MTDNIINLRKPYVLDEREAHLAPLEAAARVYCKHMDQEPDHMNSVPTAIAGVDRQRPTWLFAAEKLLDLIQMLDSLKQQPANFDAQTH